MLTILQEKMADSIPASIILSVAFMLFFGFLMTRLTKKLHLPDVTAYILTGILIGPYCLNLIPAGIVVNTDFLSDIALAFIAFSVGEFFKLSVLRKNGIPVIIITVMEACLASAAVFVLTFFLLRLPVAFSIVLAALASATAPASTVMTIRQTHAHGRFVDTLLQIVALDDVVSLIAYSVAIAVALANIAPASTDSWRAVVGPILLNIGALLLGGLFGYLLKLFMLRKHSSDNRLIISVGFLFMFCGLCSLAEVSPLLGCMSMGMVYINATGDDKLFKQLNYFSPPILLLFFVRSGMSFRLDTLFSGSSAIGGVPLFTVGILYFFVRIAGKYGGAFLGCFLTRQPKSIGRYLGLALIPQAGVAIGLASLCRRMIGGEIGQDLETIVLASSVLYEMIGPACAKLALHLSGSYSDKLEDLTDVTEKKSDGEPRPPVDVLIDRIQQIRAEQLSRSVPEESEEEKAFLQAAEEQSEEQYREPVRVRRGHFLNR